MPNEALLRAFDVCLTHVQAGSPLDQAIEMYPQWLNELTPPLEAAQALNTFAGQVQAPPGIQSASKARFLLAAESLQQRTLYSSGSRRRRVRLLWLAVALVILAGMIALVVGVNQALPDSSFYSLKEVGRQTRLWLAQNPLQRLEREYAIDAARLQDVRDLAQFARQADVSVAMVVNDTQAARWEYENLAVQIQPGTQIIGQVQPGIYLLVSGQLQPDGTIAARRVSPREYLITGTLQRLSGEETMISGVRLLVNQKTTTSGAPVIGSPVIVHAFRRLDGRLLARLIEGAPGK